MKVLITALIATLPWMVQAGTKIDRQESINGVQLETSKTDGVRTYRGKMEKTFNAHIDIIKASVVNFDQKCNNEYKDRRKLSAKDFNCTYHNDHLIETLIVRDIKPYEKEPLETDRYILVRNIYNRGNYRYHEVVKEYQGTNAQGQKFIKIALKMVSDKEASKYLEPKFERNTAFKTTDATFTLTAINDNQTQLSYEYVSGTDHWILNKEVSISQVFSSISKSFNDLLKTVDAEMTVRQARQVASQI